MYTWRRLCSIAACTAFAGCFGIGGQHLNRLSSTVSFSGQPLLRARVIAVADFDTGKGEKYYDGFSTNTPVPNAGIRMAETVATRLLAVPQYRLVERARLRHVLEELKLHMTDLVDPENLTTVGRLLGADAVVFGRTEAWSWVNQTGWGGSIDASFRLVDIETGEVLWAVQGRIVRLNTSDDQFQMLGDDMCGKLRKKLTGMTAQKP